MPRYIEADALREKMFHEAFEKDTQDQKWDSGCWIRYHMFENAIESAPTADVRENVHAHLNKVKMKSGEWWHTCSKCIATWGSEDGELDFNFCPNCGAQFDERSEDE